MQKIIYIAKNVPIPGHQENPIIYRIGKSLQKSSTIFLYPKEFFVSWMKYLILPLKKINAVARLKESFYISKTEVYVIKYLRLPIPSLSFILSHVFEKKLAERIIFSNEVKLIHSHYVLPDGELGRILSESCKIPHVVSFRDGDLKKINQISSNSKLAKKYYEVLFKADKVICHNQATFNWLNNQQLIKEKIVKIPHGIHPLKKEVRIEEKSNIILFVGHLDNNKRVDWLIQAFHSSSIKSDWQLHIVGDGPKKSELIALSHGKENIKFFGRLSQEEVFGKMSESKIFAMTSRNETFGLVYLEAALHKCAIIGTKEKGIYGWFKEGEHAFFVEDKNELESLFNKLTNNPKLCRTLGEKAWIRAKERFIWDKVIKEYDQLYTNLIK